MKVRPRKGQTIYRVRVVAAYGLNGLIFKRVFAVPYTVEEVDDNMRWEQGCIRTKEGVRFELTSWESEGRHRTETPKNIFPMLEQIAGAELVTSEVVVEHMQACQQISRAQALTAVDLSRFETAREAVSAAEKICSLQYIYEEFVDETQRERDLSARPSKLLKLDYTALSYERMLDLEKRAEAVLGNLFS